MLLFLCLYNSPCLYFASAASSYYTRPIWIASFALFDCLLFYTSPCLDFASAASSYCTRPIWIVSLALLDWLLFSTSPLHMIRLCFTWFLTHCLNIYSLFIFMHYFYLLHLYFTFYQFFTFSYIVYNSTSLYLHKFALISGSYTPFLALFA